MLNFEKPKLNALAMNAAFLYPFLEKDILFLWKRQRKYLSWHLDTHFYSTKMLNIRLDFPSESFLFIPKAVGFDSDSIPPKVTIPSYAFNDVVDHVPSARVYLAVYLYPVHYAIYVPYLEYRKHNYYGLSDVRVRSHQYNSLRRALFSSVEYSKLKGRR